VVTVENITMPQLGESVTEGTISKWLVSPGDKVEKYEPIAEIMTDKVNAEIPSSFTGTIRQLLAEEDQTLAIGEVICTIEVKNQFTQTESSQQVLSNGIVNDPIKVTNNNQGTRYSPAVLKLSQQHGIDLSSIDGSGASGRITRKDILNVIEINNNTSEMNTNKRQKISSTPSETSLKQIVTQKTSEDLTSDSTNDIEIPITPIRKTIASNMVRSKQEIPHAWMMAEVDATNLVQLREKEKQKFKEQESYPLTYFAFFVKAVSQALKEFPQLNSTWAGNQIIQKRDINISIAVAADNVLYVPVIKNADEKTIKGIAREIHHLANKAKAGKLEANDIQGGTFTVNNTGTFGSVQSMGIINYPQAAILQVESIVKRPVIIDGMIAVRDMVNLCLSLDHRILDGLICGQFLERLKVIIENISIDRTNIY